MRMAKIGKIRERKLLGAVSVSRRTHRRLHAPARRRPPTQPRAWARRTIWSATLLMVKRYCAEDLRYRRCGIRAVTSREHSWLRSSALNPLTSIVGRLGPALSQFHWFDDFLRH